MTSSVLIVPELRGDPKLFASDGAALDLFERSAYFFFVAVNGGAIEVTVTGEGRAFDGFSDLRGGDMIGAEGAEANGRHGCARVEFALGDGGGIDAL